MERVGGWRVVSAKLLGFIGIHVLSKLNTPSPSCSSPTTLSSRHKIP